MCTNSPPRKGESSHASAFSMLERERTNSACLNNHTDESSELLPSDLFIISLMVTYVTYLNTQLTRNVPCMYLSGWFYLVHTKGTMCCFGSAGNHAPLLLSHLYCVTCTFAFIHGASVLVCLNTWHAFVCVLSCTCSTLCLARDVLIMPLLDCNQQVEGKG